MQALQALLQNGGLEALEDTQKGRALLPKLEKLFGEDEFERIEGSGANHDGAENFGGPLGGNTDPQAIYDMLMLLLNKRQNENPPPKPPMQSSPWGSTQPTSWGSSGSSGSSGVSSAAPSTSTSPTTGAGTAQPVTSLKGSDKRTAEFINQHLADKKSPAADAGKPTAGEMMVEAGKKYDVDPLVLLSIAGHETGYGTLGVGMQKMLGVSAYDSDPSNINPQFDGLRNQIFGGAETFDNLRGKGGASSKDDIGAQLLAANQAGWATDTAWHEGVARHYREISASAKDFGGFEEEAVSGTSGASGKEIKSVKEAAQALLDNPNVSYWDALSSGSDRSALEDLARTGQTTVPQTGEVVTPRLEMMQALVEMANNGPIMINALTGGEHSVGSNHYSGWAVDLDIGTGDAAQIEAIANKYGGTRNSESDHIHLDFTS